MPTHCPACKKPVPPQAEDCPYCPMSFRQAERPQAYRAGVFKRLSQHPLFVPGLLAGLGLAGWKGVMWVIENAAAEGEQSPFERVIVQRGLELPQDLGAAGRLGDAPAAGAPDGAASDPGSISLDRPGEAGVEESPTVVGAGAPQEEAREWRLRGGVYDLVTLKPVARCAMIFADEGSAARLESATDAQGRYRVVAPPLKGRGYAVALRCQGYATSYLNPGAEGVREMSEEDRRALASDLGKALDPPYTIQAYGSKPLVTDFFVAPQSR